MNSSEKDKEMQLLMQKLLLAEMTELINAHRPELVKRVRKKLKDMTESEQLESSAGEVSEPEKLS